MVLVKLVLKSNFGQSENVCAISQVDMNVILYK